jgi:hypothetical protein
MKLKSILASVILALGVVSLAPKANANYTCLNSVYSSQGIAVSGTQTNTLGGKLNLVCGENSAFSFRPSVTIKDNRLGVSGSVTVDKYIIDVDAYAGLGLATNLLVNDDKVKAFFVVGGERFISSNYTLFGEVKFPFETVKSTYSPTINVGLGYKF